VEARSLFAFWAVREGRVPCAHVAAFLNITPPGVGYAIERGEVIARERGYVFYVSELFTVVQLPN
jgi:hypothetical protein